MLFCKLPALKLIIFTYSLSDDGSLPSTIKDGSDIHSFSKRQREFIMCAAGKLLIDWLIVYFFSGNSLYIENYSVCDANLCSEKWYTMRQLVYLCIQLIHQFISCEYYSHPYVLEKLECQIFCPVLFVCARILWLKTEFVKGHWFNGFVRTFSNLLEIVRIYWSSFRVQSHENESKLKSRNLFQAEPQQNFRL